VTSHHRRRRDPLGGGLAGLGCAVIITALLYSLARCAGA
jgi:hypothetical protein